MNNQTTKHALGYRSRGAPFKGLATLRPKVSCGHVERAIELPPVAKFAVEQRLIAPPSEINPNNNNNKNRQQAEIRQVLK